MKKSIIKGIAVVAAVMFLGSGIGFAGNGNGGGKGKKNGTGDRKRDGSCLNMVSSEDDPASPAADQIRKRDRKKDGSCRTGMNARAF